MVQGKIIFCFRVKKQESRRENDLELSKLVQVRDEKKLIIKYVYLLEGTHVHLVKD